jgi:hypothetical protein
MRGKLINLLTKEQHIEILTMYGDDALAAAEYRSRTGQHITRQNVTYWRKIYIENNGSKSKADQEIKAARRLLRPRPSDNTGDLSFIPDEARSILVIPDQHAPYHHPDAIRFLDAVADIFQPDLVVNLGDEVDMHAMSFHDSDPNLDSAGVELEKAKIFMEELHNLFPDMLVCDSNHGSMLFRKAKAHGIPVQMIKQYRDVLFPQHGAPGWSWADSWSVNTPLGPVMFKHQTTGLLADAAHNGTNLVVGHEHGKFDIEYSASSAHLYYGMHAGCLIDKDSLAFAYGKHSLRKPIIGCAVILDGRPTLIPMVLDRGGKWIGRV